jgi:hypothetical protein
MSEYFTNDSQIDASQYASLQIYSSENLIKLQKSRLDDVYSSKYSPSKLNDSKLKVHRASMPPLASNKHDSFINDYVKPYLQLYGGS